MKRYVFIYRKGNRVYRYNALSHFRHQIEHLIQEHSDAFLYHQTSDTTWLPLVGVEELPCCEEENIA